MSSFLDLSTELRFQIYGYMAVPYTTPFSSYIGLYLSCHQVQAEMDDECGKLLRAHLLDTQAQLPARVIDIPNTFLEMQHVHFLVPDDQHTFMNNTLYKLKKTCRLSFASITFIGNEWQDRDLNRESNFSVLLYQMMAVRYLVGSSARVERLCLDASKFFEEEIISATSKKLAFRHTQWSYGWLTKRGKPLAVWEKMSNEAFQQALKGVSID